MSVLSGEFTTFVSPVSTSWFPANCPAESSPMVTKNRPQVMTFYVKNKINYRSWWEECQFSLSHQVSPPGLQCPEYQHPDWGLTVQQRLHLQIQRIWQAHNNYRNSIILWIILLWSLMVRGMSLFFALSGEFTSFVSSVLTSWLTTNCLAESLPFMVTKNVPQIIVKL